MSLFTIVLALDPSENAAGDVGAITDGCWALAHPVVDSIKQTVERPGRDRPVLEDVDRSNLWAMETPQAFDYNSILQAYENVQAHALSITDDVAAAEQADVQVKLHRNEECNLKSRIPTICSWQNFTCKAARIEKILKTAQNPSIGPIRFEITDDDFDANLVAERLLAEKRFCLQTMLEFSSYSWFFASLCISTLWAFVARRWGMLRFY